MAFPDSHFHDLAWLRLPGCRDHFKGSQGLSTVSALAVLTFLALSPSRILAADIVDSFDSGNDSAWSRYEPLAPAGGGGTFTFPDGGYRIQAGPSPDPAGLGAMRLGSLRPDVTGGNIFAEFELVAWDDSLDQSFGLLAHASDLGAGTTDGYAISYSTAGILSISLIANEQNTVLASTPVTLDPTARYRFEVYTGEEGIGMALFTETGSNAFELLGVDDRTYSIGTLGFYLQADSPNSGVDATFDNFRSFPNVPEPSSLALLVLAGCAGIWFARRRQMNPR